MQDYLDAITETETLTTVSGGEYAGQTVAAVMVTHENAGVPTTYGEVSLAGPDSRGVRLGGRVALGD